MAAPMDLSGIILPVPTPFRDGRLDTDMLRDNLARWMAWEGRASGGPGGRAPWRIAGIVIGGSNGEAPLLEPEELWALLKAARPLVPADRLLLAGAGCESTAATLQTVLRAAELGADAVLVRPPILFRSHLTAADLVRHFEAVAVESPVPVVLYSAPRLSGADIPVHVAKALACDPVVAGLKDSGTDTGRIVEVLAGDHPVAGDGFRVLAGNATVFYPALACGAAGGILAVACLVPGLACGLQAAWEAGDQDGARRMQKRLTPLTRAVTNVHGVAGLKAALDRIGLFGGLPRRPLAPLSIEAREDLFRVLDHALWAEDQELDGGARLGDPVEA